MKLFRLALTLGGLGLLAGGLSSCLKEPDYSNTPSISFNNITIQRLAPTISGGIPRDSVRITVNYQDGDGDLGLSSDERADTLGPYSYLLPYVSHTARVLNKFHNNYFIEPYVKNPGSKLYVLASSLGLTTTGEYDSGFQHPTNLTDSKAAPIKGTLTFAPIAFALGSPFVPGQKVKFSVSIADRALNVSNTIMTDSVVIAPR